MPFTDEEVAAMGGDVTGGARPAPARGAAGGKPKTTKQKPVEISQGEYETKVAPVVSRLNALSGALGLGVDETGAITLDNDRSRALSHGLHPDVYKAVVKRAALEGRAAAGGKEGEASWLKKLFVGDQAQGGFPELEEQGFFTTPDPKLVNQAKRAWELIGKREADKDALLGDPTQFLFPSDAASTTKAEARRRLAQKFRAEARTLPTQSGGAEATALANRMADYIETLDPVHLAAPHASMKHLADVAHHASPPVQHAVTKALEEHSDPERSTILDALATGFGNNVAPMTMAGGAAIAGQMAGGPPDVAAGSPGGGGALAGVGANVPRGTPEAPSLAAANTIGQNVDLMHQRIVENLTGKTPEQQAEYIEQLKREHPVAYHAAAVGGWLADPVGLLGGKLGQAAKEGAAAAGASPLVSKAVGAVTGGAPLGVLAGRAAGSENDVENALLGTAGSAVAEGVGGLLGRLGKAAGAAPERMAQGELDKAARAIAHDLGQLEARHGHAGEGTAWEQVYAKLRQQFPDMKATQVQPANPLTGRARPNLVPELAHAADVATAGAHGGAPSASTTNLHPLVTMGNPDATLAQKGQAALHMIAEGRPGAAVTALTAGSARDAARAGDKMLAKLVTAIRGGNLDAFHAATREARAAGMSAAMIDAATEAFHRRQKMQEARDAAR